MNDNIYSNITGESIGDITENIEHSIVQYVDDTNNIISSKESKYIQPYIDGYFKLIENFYEINKLKIYPEKKQNNGSM